MGDIALADTNDQTEFRTKFNTSTQQEELEKLKKEVYLDGLQVEEEGLTDILRKKIKQVPLQDSLKGNDKLLNEAMIVRLQIISRMLVESVVAVFIRCIDTSLPNRIRLLRALERGL